MDSTINKIKSLINNIDNILKSFGSSSYKISYSEEAYHAGIIRNYLSRMLSKRENAISPSDNKIIEEISANLNIHKVLFLSIITILFTYESFIFATRGHIEIFFSLIFLSLAVFIYTISFMKARRREYFTYILLMIILIPITEKLLENFRIIFDTNEQFIKGLEIFLYLLLLFLIPSIYHKLTERYLLKAKIQRLSKLYNKHKSRFNHISPENIDIKI